MDEFVNGAAIGRGLCIDVSKWGCLAPGLELLLMALLGEQASPKADEADPAHQAAFSSEGTGRTI